MKLKTNEGKELDVNYWSFMKCYILAAMGFTGLCYGAILLLAIMFGGF